MKLEIEKERQKMFKEFKEMQDNLYSMNKKSLNILIADPDHPATINLAAAHWAFHC